MNTLITHWKLFLIFLFVGLFTSLGLRAAGNGDDDPEETMKAHNHAMPMSDHEPPAKSEGLLIDLGNEACPVMGGSVDGKTYEEWNGLRVGYCCPGCDRRFLKDPEGVLDKANIEWREAADALNEYFAATADHREHLLTAIRKRWNVIREPKGS